MRVGIRVITQLMGIGLIAVLKRVITHFGSGLLVVCGCKVESMTLFLVVIQQCGLGICSTLEHLLLYWKKNGSITRGSLTDTGHTEIKWFGARTKAAFT